LGVAFSSMTIRPVARLVAQVGDASRAVLTSSAILERGGLLTMYGISVTMIASRPS